jgi:hypothetical protein
LDNKTVETGLQQEPQLYNLKHDPREQRNLAGKYPDKVAELAGKLKEIMEKKN